MPHGADRYRRRADAGQHCGLGALSCEQMTRIRWSSTGEAREHGKPAQPRCSSPSVAPLSSYSAGRVHGLTQRMSATQNACAGRRRSGEYCQGQGALHACTCSSAHGHPHCACTVHGWPAFVYKSYVTDNFCLCAFLMRRTQRFRGAAHECSGLCCMTAAACT